MSSLSIQRIFATQESNGNLLRYRWILYQLTYQGSPGHLCITKAIFNRFCVLHLIKFSYSDYSLQFSRSVMSDSLRPHGLQHTRLPCPSPTSRACSNSCPLSRWCHSNHLILCHPLLLLSSTLPSIRIFPNESVLCIRWPKYWSFSFSISPSNDIQDCLSLGWTGWISLLSKGHSRFLSTPQFKSTQLLYTPILISVHDYWKNHSFL